MSLPPTTTPSGDETPVRGRDDACPGALRLHPADDGSLARIRVPGGLLTARQARALGRVAEELGDGRLDITSRGNAQVRGLAAGCGGELADRLRAAGLLPSDRHDRVRNIVASPLSGLDRAGHADVVAWVRELDAVLCDEASVDTLAGRGELSGLSGRFLFALDDGRGDVAALGADVTLIATPGGGAVLRVGGPPAGAGVASVGTGGAAARGDLWVRSEDAARAAALAAVEFLARARESGTRAWRVRELPAQHAVTADRLAARLADADIHTEPHPGAPGPRPPQPPPVPGPVPGPAPGPDGRHALSVALPLGRVSAAQWRLITGLASRSGADELRMTPWRGVVLPGFAPDDTRGALSELSDAGLVTTPDSPWLGVGACTGRPGCAKSLADVRAHATRMAAGTARQGAPDPLPVYVSGCERRCGHPGGRWVDALATGDTDYRVTVRGGAKGDTPEAEDGVEVTAEQLADAVAAARGTT
ncbi:MULTISPECIES: precorrin-3B synthase [Streptomyces]|uniref:precorrin-3B synthase n=1 Tax=Streptomyces lycopersici TaxID=2974589 RepID=UPI0021D31491|nr:precorrin-3B synthase [Streptomyces sp. NEAU-383]